MIIFFNTPLKSIYKAERWIIWIFASKICQIVLSKLQKKSMSILHNNKKIHMVHMIRMIIWSLWRTKKHYVGKLLSWDQGYLLSTHRMWGWGSGLYAKSWLISTTGINGGNYCNEQELILPVGIIANFPSIE